MLKICMAVLPRKTPSHFILKLKEIQMLQNNFLQLISRIFFILLLIFVSLFLLLQIANLLYPFIIAFLIASIINPFVNILVLKLKIPRYLAVIMSIIIIIAIISGIFIILINEIINGTQYLAKVIPIYYKNLIHLGQDILANNIIPIYENILLKFNKLDTNNQETIISNLQLLSDTTASTGATFITNFLLGLSSLISHLPTTFTIIIVILLATFFISNDWDKLHHLYQTRIPNKLKKLWLTISTQLKLALLGLIKAQFILISMTSIIVFVGLVILQVPYAITISILIGLIDLLPYLGTGIILIPWIIYTFIFGSTKFAIGLIILYFIILIQRQMMEPKILSSNIGIDPFATLISVFIGYQLYGFFGMIIGPVILVLLKSIYQTGVIQYIWNFISNTKS
ncbi:MAG: sporulation integral membrane protein YtvI [Mycoplasmatales bacterium]